MHEAGAERPQPVARLVTAPERRLTTGIAEFDRVLGGGLVPGSVTLIGGEPGIGKSTLLLQCAAALAKDQAVLYATGEESVRQVAERARRLAVDAATLALVAETAVERILEFAAEASAKVLVIDSIQTMSVAEVEAAPGAVTQLRESTASLVRHAKATGTAVLLIGHVTREGSIAGPRVLEHMVDTVLYFESDSGSRYRVIRAVKNRFGAANEIRRVRDGGTRAARGQEPVRDLPVPREGVRAGVGRDGGSRRHASDAHRGARTRRCERAREPAARRGRIRVEPPVPAARSAAPARGNRTRRA
jgi:predicted ATP-dependent serine protease